MNRSRYSFALTLCVLLGSHCAEAQKAPELPRIVVNIMIDQLRSDYLEAFSPLYGTRGFRRLTSEGMVYSQAEYPFARPDRASAMACVQSGATPYDNGIPSERWLDRKTLRPIYCVDDTKYLGILTTDTSSPLHLGVSTIGDELKVATEGKGIVISIAPNRDASILGAGHAADGAYWIDDKTGNWCSSSFYGKEPSWLDAYDRYYSIHSRIADIKWIPTNEYVGQFNYFISGGIRKPFSHTFKGDRAVSELKASAIVNNEVNRFAKHCIQSAGMGLDAITDILSVTYYAGNYKHASTSDCPMELQDTYVRLDADLGNLMDAVEQQVGKGRALFVVTGTGYSDAPTGTDLAKYRIPSGTFSMTRAQMLLNIYLIAVYGQGQWVESTMANQIYMNLKLIEQRNINLAEMLERCSAFLIQLSGVKDVYTSQRLSLGAWTPGISKLRNAYNPHCSGDILIQVAPGWTLVNEISNDQKVSRESYIGFPLFFLGTGIEHGRVDTPVTVDRIAPTVCRNLRIRSPNGCAQAPL